TRRLSIPAARHGGSRGQRSGCVDVPHGQADPSLTVDFEHLHAHHVAFLELVADTLDALVGDLRDVDQAIATRKDRHEGAEVHETDDFALVYPAHLHIRGDELDAALRLATGSTADGRDFHRAIVLDV